MHSIRTCICMIDDNNNSYACEPGFGEKNKVYVANFACCLIQAYNIRYYRAYVHLILKM